jgi:hypothetical protein
MASKQQKTDLFLSAIVTGTRSHTELTKKLTHLMGNLCLAREYSVQIFAQFFTQLNCTFQLGMYGALYMTISKQNHWTTDRVIGK